ncbi:MAG: DUF5615 family PIN-like protein [Bryobacteraceae bacterium]
MRIKLDENLPLELANDLKRLGHDTDTVASEGLTGADDDVVGKEAARAERVLFTLDKGIANFQRYPGLRLSGVVLLRPDVVGRGAVGAVLEFIRGRLPMLLALELEGKLTVVGATRVRTR